MPSKKRSSVLIRGAYDSHIHLLGTGLKFKTLDLSILKLPIDFRNLLIKSSHFRGKVLFGFGWNDSSWNKDLWKDLEGYVWGQSKFSYSKVLDQYFNYPVFFVSSDGHRAWLNSHALQELQSSGSGLLEDNLKAVAQAKLDPYSKEQTQEAIGFAQSLFNSAGFTHIRDMSGDQNYWEALSAMDSKLTLRIEQNIGVENPDNFSKALSLAVLAKKEKLFNIRIKGVKVYYDGSLGSGSALLTENYLDQKEYSYSNPLIGSKELKEMLTESWLCGLELSIHTIGNKAAENVLNLIEEVVIAFKKASKLVGVVNLEHVQLLNKNSLAILARHKNIICHMQPCHFLTDKVWLKNKLSKKLLKELFQWRQLEAQGQLFYFGSDSPVELSSLFTSKEAILEAISWGIPSINKPWEKYHSHPDKSWVGKSYTRLDQDKKEILEVCFNGKIIY